MRAPNTQQQQLSQNSLRVSKRKRPHCRILDIIVEYDLRVSEPSTTQTLQYSSEGESDGIDPMALLFRTPEWILSASLLQSNTETPTFNFMPKIDKFCLAACVSRKWRVRSCYCLIKYTCVFEGAHQKVKGEPARSGRIKCRQQRHNANDAGGGDGADAKYSLHTNTTNTS